VRLFLADPLASSQPYRTAPSPESARMIP